MFNKKLLYLIFLLTCLSYFFYFSGVSFEDKLSPNKNVMADSNGIPSIKTQPYKSIALVNKNDSLIDYKKKDQTKALYLTFDDGPNKHTKKIISILKKKDINATFFMLNENILKNREVTIAVKKAGNQLGCHGVTHNVNRFYQTKKAPLKEMETCKKSILKVSGYDTHLIRVPYGSYPYLSSIQKKYLEKAGFVLWDWNVDSQDWLNKGKSPKLLINHVIKQVKAQKKLGNTPVILLHDTDISVRALPKLIDKLLKMGYSFQTIEEDLQPLQFKRR